MAKAQRNGWTETHFCFACQKYDCECAMMKAGYYGVGEMRGRFVAFDEALDYALEQCGIKFVNPEASEYEEFKEMLEDWFFSGSWIKRSEMDSLYGLGIKEDST